MQAIILAGGKGTRLKDRLKGAPKPLVEVAGIPLLTRQFRHLACFGVNEVLLLVNHAADQIERHIAREHLGGMRVDLLDDGEPLGTAGAVLKAFDRLQNRFLVVYGDTLINVDIAPFLATHARQGADATLFLHPNNHPQDSDIVEIDDDGWVKSFHPYPHAKGKYLPNLVNAALYVIEKRALVPWLTSPVPSDFGKNLFPAMLGGGARLFGYVSYEYIRDLGTSKRLDEVEHDVRTGVVDRASRKVPQRAVFVDRDGTLNRSRGFISDPTEIELLPGVAEGIRRLNKSEFRVVVVTNQPVVARGEASFTRVKQIHNRLEMLLGEGGAFVDGIYVCPHHPDKGFAGEVAELKFDCDCRKPKTGLVDTAARDMNINRNNSWMIGDTTRDIEMARRAGLRSILLETGQGGRDRTFQAKADHRARDFSSAVNLILNESEQHA